MVFSSPRFFLFLIALLLVLAIPLGRERQKTILALASAAFYAAWDYHYLALLLAIGFIDYACAARIHRATGLPARRGWLLASLASNLGILAYFKYCDFFIGALDNLLVPVNWGLPLLHVVLPAGISFYTFKSLSYTIDVYRKQIEPCRSQLDYLTFLTFFPDLIAGPIVRASIFLPQMDRPIGPSAERLASGGSLFLLGLTKKLLVADPLANIADPIFARPEIFSCATLWCGTLAYALQIYCDFSGYSDMAIGTARMIGYDLPLNFNMPYLSASVTEFWRRWHMTLSTWLRDYLYISLGGNRLGRTRTYLNLLATMLLGGLWHGAGWNFVVWGGLHGMALAVNRHYREQANRFGWRLPLWPARCLTFLFVLVCWVPFRSPDLASALTMLRGLIGAGSGNAVWYPEILAWCAALVVLGHVLGTQLDRAWTGQQHGLAVLRLLHLFNAQLCGNEVSGWFVRLGAGGVAGAFLVVFWPLFILYFGALNVSPFIYFRF